MDIGLNEHHRQNVVNYLRFARYGRGQRLRGVQASFEELKDSRLVEDTYTLDEITDMLDGLCAVIKAEVESELINAAHTNVLLLRQVFSQAERWHLKLQADISELENRELIDEIAKFEERELSSTKSTKQSKLSKLSQVPKLEPLNEGGGTALLQMQSEKELLTELIRDQQKVLLEVLHEINRLNDDNAKLRDRIRALEGKATSVIGEKSKIQADLESTQAALKAKGNAKTYGKEVFNLEQQMAAAKMDLKRVKDMSVSQTASLEEELTKCKHDILKLQHDLEEAQKDLSKKFNETTQYKNMKQMLTSKNDQIKELRGKLRRYEPD